MAATGTSIDGDQQVACAFSQLEGVPLTASSRTGLT
jgi:hypothetical protein